MKVYLDILERILAVSDRGLDIITDCCPAAAEVVNNPKKKFRLRSDERTPSALLYPPRDSGDSWRVVDYGMADGERSFSPVDLYMWVNGYDKSRFMLTLQELAQRFGVSDTLSANANKPDIRQRPATEEEIQSGQPVLDLFEGYGNADLSHWGPAVKAGHLEALGWRGVRSLTVVKGQTATIITATDTYPIYAQRCPFVDSQGQEHFFWKVYEPKNFDKAFRFRIVGPRPPKDYIYGLPTLQQDCQEAGHQLDEVLLVSGGSDAVAARSMGYTAVWLGSETAQLTPLQLKLLGQYARRVVNIPDVDATGRRMGRQLALRYPTLYTAWLRPDDFGTACDNRQRPCKDLRDYLRLHPGSAAMRTLIERAQCSLFWTIHTNEKTGERKCVINDAALNYFCTLHGYATMKDDRQEKPVYVQVDGMKVTLIKAKSIRVFLKEWCQREGVEEMVQNALFRAKGLPTDTASLLEERSDLDFTDSTPTSQRVFFRNTAIEVTAEGIRRLPYSTEDGHYVWADSIMAHDYRDIQPQFTVAKGDDDRYHVTLRPGAPSKLLPFLHRSSRLYWRKADELDMPLTDEEQAEEEQCLLAKLVNLGYHMHTFKDKAASWATICMDAKVGDTSDQANGRSGKTIYRNAVGAVLNPLELDGRKVVKASNPQFMLAGWHPSNRLITCDECPKGFDFNLFNEPMTGNLSVEKKGKDPIVVPFNRSPKWLFCYNFTLTNHDPSTEGRIWLQLFSDYYHVQTPQNDYRETRTVYDDLGTYLMDESTSETDWQADLHLLLECLQLYLSLPRNDRRQLPPMTHIQQREAQAKIDKTFLDWANEVLAPGSIWLDNESVRAKDLQQQYAEEVQPHSLPPRWFTTQLKQWCEYAPHIACYNPASITHNKKDGERWNRTESGQKVQYYYLQTVDAQTQTDNQLDIEELPLVF